MRGPSLLLLLLVGMLHGHAQSGIVQQMGYWDYGFYDKANFGARKLHATHPSAIIELGDSLYSRAGLLIPRGKKDSIQNPARGLVFFDIPTSKLVYYNGTVWINLDGSNGPNVLNGTGNGNYVARWTGSSSLGTGVLRDDGVSAAIGIAPTPSYKLYVAGHTRFTGNMILDALSGGGEQMMAILNNGLVVPRPMPITKNYLAGNGLLLNDSSFSVDPAFFDTSGLAKYADTLPMLANYQHWKAGYLKNITGLVIAGSNTVVTGLGTPASPYQVSFVNSAGTYVLPPATDTSLGGIKVGAGLQIDANTGVLSTTSNGGVVSVFGRTGVVTAQESDYSSFYPLLSGSYANPAWITSLPWSKITGAPTTLAGYGITDAESSSHAAATYQPIGSYLNNISGLVTAGANMTRTGSGTAADPYVFNSTASGTGGIDSVRLKADSLKEYRAGVATPIAKVARFYYPTAPQTGDRLRYNALDSTWRNSSGDSIATMTSFPTTGNMVIRSDIYGGSLWFKVNNIWKRLTVADSVAVGTTEYGYSFTGASQNVTVASSTPFDFGYTQPWTVGFWGNLTSTTGQLRIGLSTPSKRVWDVAMSYAGGVRVEGAVLNDAQNAYYYTVSTTTQTVNNWYYVVVTYDGVNKVQIYINGALNNGGVTGNNGTVSTTATGGTFTIGKWTTFQSTSANVDELFVANTALSPAQITTLYNSGSPNPASQSWYAANAVAFWKFQNNLTDEKGSSNGTATTPQYITR